MENKRSVCKICFRSFANGRALGGHMTSHPAELRHPPPPPTDSDEYSFESTEHPFQFSSASSSLDFHTRNNSKHNLRTSKCNPYSTFANFGWNNELDFGSKYPTQQRSKRNRKFFNAARAKVEDKQRSSTYVLSVVEAAETLIFMSMDTWEMPKNLQIYSSTSETHEGNDGGEDVDIEE